MKKNFNIEGIDCANCATKLEDKINKIDGVNEATINFMMAKLYVDADCSTEEEFEELLAKIKEVTKKIEPDAVIL